jgi:CRP-like cAMP-binding protein
VATERNDYKVMSVFHITDLFKETHLKEYPKGQMLYYEGDSIELLHCIETGYVKVYNISHGGSERIIFIYGPGDVFPLMSYLRGDTSLHWFYSTMTSVSLRSIRPKLLMDRMRNDILVGEALANYAISISDEFIQRIEMLSVNDSKRKIVALLAFLVKKAGAGRPHCEIGVPITQQDMADMSGLTRESTSRQLVNLRSVGLLIGPSNKLVVDLVKLEIAIERLGIVI